MVTQQREETRDGYAALRHAILSGRFGPNERLVEADITAEFGMPRAAVRTAFVRLEMEGLVQREPNKGTRVRSVSDEEALEIIEARAALEGLTARHAAERATPQDVARLQQAAARHRSRVERGDVLGSADANVELHALIREIAGRPTLTRLVEQLNSQTTRFQYRTGLIPGRAAAVSDEHDAVVAAIAAGDADKAERAMRRHLSNVGAALSRASTGS
jgi:DNA-binding GntR family transcriptional regulator